MSNIMSSIFGLESWVLSLRSSIFSLQTRVRWPILWLALQGKGFGREGNKKPHGLGRVDRDSRHELPSVRWTLNFKPTVTRERPHQWEQHKRSTMWAINPTSLPQTQMGLNVIKSTQAHNRFTIQERKTTSLQNRLGITNERSIHKPPHKLRA